MSSLPVRPTGGKPATSKTRARRTHQENCVSFVNKIPILTTGFVWPAPQATLDLVASAGLDGNLGVFVPCPARDSWRTLDTAPPNVFGLRLCQCENKKAMEALTCGSQCDFCVSLGPSPTRKVLASFDRLRLGFKRLEVPEWARVVQPGDGILFTMEAEGPFTFIFSGLAYFYAVRAKDDKAAVVENRLPVAFSTPRYKLTGFPDGVHASGASLYHAPSVLVQLTFKGPASLTLTVPNEASHAFPSDQGTWSTRPGYVYNVISKKNAYRCTRIKAAECLYMLRDPDFRLVQPTDGGAPVFEKHNCGLKRLREDVEDDDEEEEEEDVEDQNEKKQKLQKKTKRARTEEKDEEETGRDLIEDEFEDDNNNSYDPSGFQFDAPSDETLSLAQEHEPPILSLHGWNDYYTGAAAFNIDRGASLMAKPRLVHERSAAREPGPLPTFEVIRWGADMRSIVDEEKNPCIVCVNKDATLIVKSAHGEFICGVTHPRLPGTQFGIETRMRSRSPQLVSNDDWSMGASDIIADARGWTTVLDPETLEHIATPLFGGL
jgi:hypothetical protein